MNLQEPLFSHARHCFQIVSNDFFVTDFVRPQIHKYADRCSRLLAIDACLLVKIVFLLSRMSTKIDFCRTTGHDHGGWQVAAAVETKTTSMAEAAAVGRRRHHQWRRRKHRHRIVVDDSASTTTTITMNDGNCYKDNCRKRGDSGCAEIRADGGGSRNGGGCHQSTKCSEDGGGGDSE